MHCISDCSDTPAGLHLCHHDDHGHHQHLLVYDHHDHSHPLYLSMDYDDDYGHHQGLLKDH